MAECSSPAPKNVTVAPGLVQKALWLACVTIVYNVAEGLVSVSFGAREESSALAGFGIDSFIEVASAVLVLWRLRSDFQHGSLISVRAERRATLGIGILFGLLALIAAGAAAFQLVQRSHPDSTVPGLIVSIVSLGFTFFLWRSKLSIARALDSKTVAADAACSLACIKLSLVLFLGSLAFLADPNLWWADSVATIAIALLIAKEGWEMIEAARNENFQGGCGCH